MCIYTVKMQQLKKKLKNSSWGVRDSTVRPKIRRLRRKGYARTNKDRGMSCYIQVEYSVFFHWNLSL